MGKSWLSDVGDFLGIGGSNEGSGGGFNWGDILPSLITAGGGLAQTYFTLDQQNANNAFAAQQAEASQKWQAEQNAAALGAKIAAAKIAAGAAIKSQRINQLGNLYSNWGSLMERGGESAAQSAQATGKMGSEPIIARLQALR